MRPQNSQTSRRGDAKAGHRLWKPFLRDRRGSTGIEFALLALPFCMLTFAVLESCITFAGQQVLANAADDVARQIRTGQLRKATMSETDVRNKICDQLKIVVTSGCPGLKIDLREYATFKLAADETFGIKSGQLDAKLEFNPGKAMTKNMLRVFYEWPVMTDFLRASMAPLNDGKTLLFASVAWQNEPFDD